jgi:hypothetical protein
MAESRRTAAPDVSRGSSQRIISATLRSAAPIPLDFGSPLALPDVFAEYRLDVDNRRPIQSFETAHTRSRKQSTAVISTRCRPMGFGR